MYGQRERGPRDNPKRSQWSPSIATETIWWPWALTFGKAVRHFSVRMCPASSHFKELSGSKLSTVGLGGKAPVESWMRWSTRTSQVKPDFILTHGFAMVTEQSESVINWNACVRPTFNRLAWWAGRCFNWGRPGSSMVRRGWRLRRPFTFCVVIIVSWTPNPRASDFTRSRQGPKKLLTKAVMFLPHAERVVPTRGNPVTWLRKKLIATAPRALLQAKVRWEWSKLISTNPNALANWVRQDDNAAGKTASAS